MTLEINVAVRQVIATASMVQLSWALGEVSLSAAGASDSSALDKYFSRLQEAVPSVSSIYFGWTGGDQVSLHAFATIR